MKSNLIIFYSLFSVVFFSQAQGVDRNEIKTILEKVSNRIMSETTFDFVNKKTGKVFTDIKSQEIDINIEVRSYFNDWRYENGVTFMGLQQVSKVLQNSKYDQFVKRNFDWIFNNGHLTYYEKMYNQVLTGSLKVENTGEFAKEDGLVGRVSYHQMFRLNRLDDCGSLASAMIESYNNGHTQDKFMAYIKKTADYILNKEHRLSNRAFCRTWPRKNAVWADDLYMGIPFLAKYAKMTNNDAVFDDAANQIIQYHDMLWNKEMQLFHHCYYADINEKGTAHWGRSNGWVIVAQVMLLEQLPVNHPKRNELIQILKEQIKGLSRYQDKDGLWHQLLDKPDSYPETSCTAMFVYGIAKAVNEGWVDKDYMDVAECGWNGLKSMLDKDCNLQNVCMGTGIRQSQSYYYNRPTHVNGHHALGAFLLAGSELYKSQPFAYPKWD